MSKHFLMTTLLTAFFLLVFLSCEKDSTSSKDDETVTDIDGNVYKTVTIGVQVWMAENLKTIHYRNGDAIPCVTNITECENLTTGAYCYYGNDPNNAITYGHLYNWYAVNDCRTIAPAGWHIPSDYEWQTLVDLIGGDEVAGGKMKETGTSHWNSPNTGATNKSGFSALPGGVRINSGYYGSMGEYAGFWSSRECGSYYAWNRSLYYDRSEVGRERRNKNFFCSVRCVRN